MFFGAAAIGALCWAYSLAARFTNFLSAPKEEKIIIIISLLTAASLFSAWLFIAVLNPLSRTLSKKTMAISLGLSAVAVAVLFSMQYQLPPFPEHHSLTIKALDESNPLSVNSKVEVLFLNSVSLPSEKQRRIPASQLNLEGSWQGTNNGYGIAASNDQVASATFQHFMQAGMLIQLKTGPQGGIVNITWDGDQQKIDLYSPQTGTHKVFLEPKLDWQSADLIRKILITGALASDFLGLIIFITATILIVNQLFSGKKLVVRKPGLIILCLTLVSGLLFFANQLNREVFFENPHLEAVVRDVLKKPSGIITQHQLLPIVTLDASGRGITSLEGIENMPNLMQLKLRDNEISDIAPLAQLKYLRELNLRNNAVTDLTPLAKLSELTYLNIHSNPGIESIRPLKNLKGLRTLIMGNVPIKNEISILENFPQLTNLNLRGSGVVDLEPISHLTALEHLNLYLNPKIESIAPLVKLINLQELILAGVPVKNEIDIIAGLPKLQYLNLRDSKLNDISALAKLSKLKYLNLHSNPEINSIEPIKNLTNMRTLILRGVPIGDQVDILSDLTNLQKLNLRDTGITKINPVGNLMARGALQDNLKTGVLADVDIRDNLISRAKEDNFASVRPFWQNITLRKPAALPFFASLRDVNFSQPAGFYESSILLKLSSDEPDVNIHYTLDGSEPTEKSPVFSEPILIASRAGEPNLFSAIESVAADWKKPEHEVTKAIVVRAKAINEQTGEASATGTQTFFIGDNLVNRYTLPVVSLATDPQNFFDETTGAYVLGKSYKEQSDADLTEDERQTFANYNQHGRAWEQPISFEFFESGGKAVFAQNGGVRIHGGGSRRYPQKTLRFNSGNEYDLKEFFSYPLFTGKSNESGNKSTRDYKTFLLRNSGQDWMKSMFRDAFVQSLVSNPRLATQAAQPVIAFLNGEYWGIYTLQERYDEYYIANHYGIEPDQSVILRQSGILFRGEDGDEKHYADMLNYIRKNGLSDPEHYRYIQTQMDVDNYIDYLIAEIYSGNDDWPDNNIYLWRMKTDGYKPNAPYGQDGRWRWMLFDLDFGFGLKGGAEDYKLDTIEVAKQPGWGGFLFRSLLENEEFRSKFVRHFEEQINTTYAPERVTAILDQWEATLRPEIQENLLRWGTESDTLENWEKEVEVIRMFALKRPEAMRKLITKHFSLDAKE